MTEPCVLLTDDPSPRDYRAASEVTLADALLNWGDLDVTADRPDCDTDFGGPGPYGRRRTGRVHLALRDGSPQLATLVVLDADLAGVTGGSHVPLRHWFAPRTPCADPADGEIVVHDINPDHRCPVATAPFRVLPDGSLRMYAATRFGGFREPCCTRSTVTREGFFAAPHLAVARCAWFRNTDGGTWTWATMGESVDVRCIPRPDGYDGPAVPAGWAATR